MSHVPILRFRQGLLPPETRRWELERQSRTPKGGKTSPSEALAPSRNGRRAEVLEGAASRRPLGGSSRLRFLFHLRRRAATGVHVMDALSSLRLSCSCDEEILYRLIFFFLSGVGGGQWGGVGGGGHCSAFTSWRQGEGPRFRGKRTPSGELMVESGGS